jgi:hypothetical protein
MRPFRSAGVRRCTERRRGGIGGVHDVSGGDARGLQKQ